MHPITKALVWAGAIILFALLAASGLVENETARTMLIILPVLAWTTLGNARGCAPCPIIRNGDNS
ncbi:hypothetical protein [Erythrobacter alti]|uniref:hypothetical protein n=1 Tax=Erythrobacter alti TaxID=1896145 RepID=UPI0030F4129D